MKRIQWRSIVLLAVCAMTIAATPKTSSAANGDFLNWLFPYRAHHVAYRYGAVPTTAYYRTAAYYPTTAYYGSTASYGGCNSCGTSACGTSACGTSACGQRVVTNYAPQTCYRTAWARVPVTTYRPAIAVDPCTGCQTTVMRPCTSTVWQVQRVPYTTYRPIYSLAPTTCYSPCGNSCSGCGTATASACSSCSNCTSTTVQLPLVTPESNGIPTQADVPANSAPELQLEPSASVERIPQATPATNVVPIPDTQAEQKENRAPLLLDPNDREAFRPIRQASHTRETDRLAPVTTQVIAVEPVTSPAVDSDLDWDPTVWEIVE